MYNLGKGTGDTSGVKATPRKIFVYAGNFPVENLYKATLKRQSNEARKC